MWGHPMFDNPDAAALMMELRECRKVYGGRYIRVVAFDASPGWESVRMSFIVNRPTESLASSCRGRKGGAAGTLHHDALRDEQAGRRGYAS
jgi:ribulose bisphosphate carboxylase small subunit